MSVWMVGYRGGIYLFLVWFHIFHLNVARRQNETDTLKERQRSGSVY